MQVNGTDGSYGSKNDNCKVKLGVPDGAGGQFTVSTPSHFHAVKVPCSQNCVVRLLGWTEVRESSS